MSIATSMPLMNSPLYEDVQLTYSGPFFVGHDGDLFQSLPASQPPTDPQSPHRGLSELEPPFSDSSYHGSQQRPWVLDTGFDDTSESAEEAPNGSSGEFECSARADAKKPAFMVSENPDDNPRPGDSGLGRHPCTGQSFRLQHNPKGAEKTKALYLPGAMLHSQTSDSQWLPEIDESKSPQASFAEPHAMRRKPPVQALQGVPGEDSKSESHVAEAQEPGAVQDKGFERSNAAPTKEASFRKCLVLLAAGV
ncbi:hypothetical protein K474DRAFT_583611 [Panus rudis PR-1116 ss-1]|nr:hypothetical protein K474DRAFT_583611 [Panus rudis PR-1116 ss-1]